MKKMLVAAAMSILCCAAFAGDGLDDFLRNTNVQARADMAGFSVSLSSQFGVNDVQVRAVLGSVGQPADAFMIFQLGAMTHQPVERVLQVYRSGHGKGWGAIAKDLGIKPGSPEFHALKRGDFRLASAGGEASPADHGKGHGHGRGKNNH
ncbi:hypothetical protein [Noviherbaspirillum autotrophicum]|uniref:Uncharacterized protein n=1 Tax=Noviherbaspirillum autotrophicum TaxID=709839 RepID=A0A0C2BYX7_9BURK|nr:hypothetical protein [Noviherbaspirillum autotrophicum]KIF83211.1 hypothetical protein TSA66_24055 [Noviherbaspirillum autotrophicum]